MAYPSSISRFIIGRSPVGGGFNSSGTINQTTIDTAVVIEHSLRRCGVKTASQTPEIIDICLENLYLLLVGLSNAGINLWCVEEAMIGLQTGQASYALPPGTVDLLNLTYSQPQRITGTDSISDKEIIIDLGVGNETKILHAGIKFSSVYDTDTIVLSSSINGSDWVDVAQMTGPYETQLGLVTDTWYWLSSDPAPSVRYWKFMMGESMVAAETYLASTISDIPVIQFNRDTYYALPDRHQQGRPSVNYYLEKLLNYKVNLWPVPNNSYDHLTAQVHRQVQDVGALTQQLYIPQRWLNSIIWELTKLLCFELPTELVDQARVPSIIVMANEQINFAGIGESDGAPTRLIPRISGYTR